jgi:hypothetical protein
MRAMRNAALIVFLAACGGGQQATNTEPVHLDKPDAATAALPNKPVQPLGIPHDAPFVASFDATAFAKIVPLAAEVERELDLPPGALVEQAGSLGFDTKRPVTIAVAPLDDAQTKLVTELRAKFKDPNVQPTDDVVKRIVAMEAPVVVRILVPSTNAEKLEQSIAKFLVGDHWHKSAHGFSKYGQHIVFDDDGQNVAVDFFMTGEQHAGDPKGYRAFSAGAHDPAPPLDGRTGRATWNAAAVAMLGYFYGVQRAASAVSGDSLDAGQRLRIMREGLTEADEGFLLANFDRIDVEGRLTPFEFIGRAKPGAGFAMPPADALAQSTGVAVTGGGSVALAQASRAFVRGWPFPGGSAKTAIEAMRDGGMGAIVAGIPHLLAMLPIIESRRSRTSAAFDMSRFDRVATSYNEKNGETFISVMPSGTKRADAECAFAPKAPCDAKTKLKTNAVVKIEELNAKLYEIDKRFVVVSSTSEAAKLDAPTLVQVAGNRLDVDTSFLSQLLAPNTLPAKISGEITNDNGTLVFRAH